MTDIFDLVKQQAEMIIRKEGLEATVVIIEGTDKTRWHPKRKRIEFGKWRLQATLGWGAYYAGRYFKVEDDKILSYSYRIREKLTKAERLCSTIIEEIAHVKLPYRKGDIHDWRFYRMFKELYEKYAEEVIEALEGKANTYIPKALMEGV